MIRAMVAVALICAAAPAHAASDGGSIFPITVPPACQELAQRHGIPDVINGRFVLIRALRILSRLPSKDPAVRECQAVVRAMLPK